MDIHFLSKEKAEEMLISNQTPFYVYSEKELVDRAREFLAFPNSFWLTVRYAMKALPNMTILSIFDREWIHLDCSSEFEVFRAISAGILPEKIQLTSQEVSKKLKEVLDFGIFYNATSLRQLEEYWKVKPNSEVSVRINPWLWSGWTKRTNVWWPSSSFGIWYEYIDQINEIAEKYNLNITKIHTHIGSGSDPDVWAKVSEMSLNLLNSFPNVHTLNLWGGFKVWRMPEEKTVNLQEIWEEVRQKFEEFSRQTGRQIHLEVEPWTYLVANSGTLVTQVQDIVDTWKEGYNFIKINAWMTELTRPTMYWAQHPISVLSDSTKQKEYLIVWHCCESWDIFTPENGDPEWLKPRIFNTPEIWDLVLIRSAWAYSASMSTKNYNSFPECGEVLLRENWQFDTIRNRQNFVDIWKNEIKIKD